MMISYLPGSAVKSTFFVLAIFYQTPFFISNEVFFMFTSENNAYKHYLKTS